MIRPVRELILVCCLFLLTACSSCLNFPSESPNPEFMTFSGAKVHLTGRFDRTQEGQARFTWPGSALEFRFEGSSASIALASNARVRFELKVDGEVSDLWVEAGNNVYVLASGLDSGVHQIRITRLTESFTTVSAFISDPVVDGVLLSPPAEAERHLLVIGDSITAGYGNEGESQSCSYSMETSNQQLTYTALAAQALDADLHTIAWSGIGAWRSYGETTPVNPNILVRYQRTLADDPDSLWNVEQYQPDAILINIGTNDYWDGSAGPAYADGLRALLKKMQQDYPEKPVYLIVSSMLNGAVREAQQAVLNSLVGKGVSVVDLGKIEAADGFGCDYHPNKLTHARMGSVLEKRLREDLGW